MSWYKASLLSIAILEMHKLFFYRYLAGKSSPQPQSTHVADPALWGLDKPSAWLPLEVNIAQQEQDEQNDQQ